MTAVLQGWALAEVSMSVLSNEATSIGPPRTHACVLCLLIYIPVPDTYMHQASLISRTGKIRDSRRMCQRQDMGERMRWRTHVDEQSARRTGESAIPAKGRENVSLVSSSTNGESRRTGTYSRCIPTYQVNQVILSCIVFLRRCLLGYPRHVFSRTSSNWKSATFFFATLNLIWNI